MRSACGAAAPRSSHHSGGTARAWKLAALALVALNAGVAVAGCTTVTVNAENIVLQLELFIPADKLEQLEHAIAQRRAQLKRSGALAVAAEHAARAEQIEMQ